MLPLFFTLTLLLMIWIYYQKSRTDRSAKSAHEAFWDKERKANLTRKKDISELDYITIPINQLPFPELQDEEITEVQKRLQKLSTEKIVNFTGITNTELKLQYGAPNIELLMAFDKNYLELVRTLYRYAKLLYEQGYKEEATAILEYGISIKTAVSANYTLLASIYKEKNDTKRIDFIISQAELLNSLTKKSLLNSLIAIRDSSIH